MGMAARQKLPVHVMINDYSFIGEFLLQIPQRPELFQRFLISPF